MQYVAGISISLFIVALLLNKRGKSRSDIILLVWMVINVIHLSLQYSYSSGSMMDYPFLYGIVAPIPLLHGVCLYLYVASVTNQFPKKAIGVWIHLVPAALNYLYFLRYYFFLPKAEQAVILGSRGGGHELFVAILFSTIALSGVIYVIWSIILLRRHRRNILNRFSVIEKINLRWLQFLIYGLGLLWAVVIFSQKDEHIYIGVLIFVILTGFFGIQQVDIFKKRESNPLADSKDEDAEKKEKYARSGLTADLSQKLYAELSALVENKAVYKQQELSVGDLAEMLDTHPNYLSQVINEKTGKSFYDYINTYRVEDFKKLVKEPESKNFTLLSLAYECGFNSKSSFNRYFKKETGLTPSQYLNKLT